jgi:putative hydrolase of the HAD superfamily
MVRAVTVDAHGVLLLPDPDVIRAVLEVYSCAPDDEDCWNAHYQMMRILDQMTHDDWPYLNRSFAEALGVRQSKQDEAGAILAEKVYLGTAWIAAPGAASALAHLVARGFGAAVISGTLNGDIAQTLLNAGICSEGGDFTHVAAVVDSQKLGVAKPDPRPFQVALNALDESSANCVHAGDSLRKDVVGALGVGMSAIHIDPLHVCVDDQHGHFSSFAQFVGDLVG